LEGTGSGEQLSRVSAEPCALGPDLDALRPRLHALTPAPRVLLLHCVVPRRF